MPNHIAINMPNARPSSHIAINMSYAKPQSYVTINIKNDKRNKNNKTRKYKPNKYNAHSVNTNDPFWLEKEGVNASYNLNVESKKQWLARQPKKNRKTRKYRRC